MNPGRVRRHQRLAFLAERVPLIDSAICQSMAVPQSSTTDRQSRRHAIAPNAAAWSPPPSALDDHAHGQHDNHDIADLTDYYTAGEAAEGASPSRSLTLAHSLDPSAAPRLPPNQPIDRL